jgi:hypothetical protein
VPFPHDRARHDNDGSAHLPALAGRRHHEDRGVRLADPDVERQQAAAVLEDAARRGDLVRLGARCALAPAGDVDGLARIARDDPPTIRAVVGVRELGAPRLVDADPAAKRLSPALRQLLAGRRQTALGLLALLAGRRGLVATPALALDLEQGEVVVEPAQAGDRRRGEAAESWSVSMYLSPRAWISPSTRSRRIGSILAFRVSLSQPLTSSSGM